MPDSESSRVPAVVPATVAAAVAPAAVDGSCAPCSEALVPNRLRARGECVADLCRRIVLKRLTKEVLCLKLKELTRKFWGGQISEVVMVCNVHLRWGTR